MERVGSTAGIAVYSFQLAGLWCKSNNGPCRDCLDFRVFVKQSFAKELRSSAVSLGSEVVFGTVDVGSRLCLGDAAIGASVAVCSAQHAAKLFHVT